MVTPPPVAGGTVLGVALAGVAVYPSQEQHCDDAHGPAYRPDDAR